MASTSLRIIENGQRTSVFVDHILPEKLTHILMGSFRLLMLQRHIEGFTSISRFSENQHIENLISLISKKLRS